MSGAVLINADGYIEEQNESAESTKLCECVWI